eukprot:364690-Chlamydomonas_euryale.AAC.4
MGHAACANGRGAIEIRSDHQRATQAPRRRSSANGAARRCAGGMRYGSKGQDAVCTDRAV